MTYEEQLLTPEWKACRHWIIERDMYMCQRCMRQDGLQVHHKRYIAGKMAWEYEDKDLITLCRKCHADEHGKPVDESKIDNRMYDSYDESVRRSRRDSGTGLRHIREVMLDNIKRLMNG